MFGGGRGKIRISRRWLGIALLVPSTPSTKHLVRSDQHNFQAFPCGPCDRPSDLSPPALFPVATSAVFMPMGPTGARGPTGSINPSMSSGGGAATRIVAARLVFCLSTSCRSVARHTRFSRRWPVASSGGRGSLRSVAPRGFLVECSSALGPGLSRRPCTWFPWPDRRGLWTTRWIPSRLSSAFD